ncbi:MAG: hypothetical protein R3Y28_03770 [Candidatus Gastranaerophilales bacterium]
MINKVSQSNININNSAKDKNKHFAKGQQPASKTSFNGGIDSLIWASQQCEKNPMVNVSVLDLTSAILPRTFFETVMGSKTKDEDGNTERKLNIHGGFEAFRRESSGLIVNCLLPSFIVMGATKALEKPIMGGYNKSSLVNTWANDDSLDKIQQFYSKAEGKGEEKIYNTFKSMFNSIEGVDGDAEKGGLKNFKDFYDEDIDTALRKMAKASIEDKPKDVSEAYQTIVKKTKIAENIKFNGDKGFFSNNLEALFKDGAKVLHGVEKEGISNADELGKYISKAKKLVRGKSILGMGIIIPLAISMQPINRWITHKLSGQKGAPIYNDDKQRKLSDEEKSELNKKKMLAVPLMAGVAALSMLMDKPSLKMFQFKGLFPTMDQARIISTATFASRLASSEDANELKENTVRDIATFSSFYFLGDYVAKGVASLIEKNDPSVKLINRRKSSKEDANIAQKFWNWAKHSSMKSTDELTSIKDKRLRSLCQLSNLTFSLFSLGMAIPAYTRHKTQQKEKEKLAKLNLEETSNIKQQKFTSPESIASLSLMNDFLQG